MPYQAAKIRSTLSAPCIPLIRHIYRSISPLATLTLVPSTATGYGFKLEMCCEEYARSGLFFLALASGVRSLG